MSVKLSRAACAAIQLSLLAGAAPALAAEAAYPTRPIRLIVPYPPGGSTDPTARAYGGWLSDKLGVPLPGEPKLIVPGLALARSTSSLTVFAGTEGWVTSRNGT